MNPHLEISFAPIQGMTDAVYREAFQASFRGVDRYFLPFVRNPKSLLETKAGRKKQIPAAGPETVLVPQLLSNQADEILHMDQALWEMGYREFNWNLGCPAPMVTPKKRGAGLLPHAGHIEAILEEVMGRLHCRLSIKARLGLEHPEEILVLLPVFNRYPIREIILHPRLGKQMYRGHADLETFEACLAMSRHPVIYNGDIFCVQTWETLRKRFPGVRGWMLGRGILANPFLAEQIQGLAGSGEGRLERIVRFHDLYVRRCAETLSGPGHVLDKLKAFWAYLHFLFEDGAPLFKRLVKLKHLENYHASIHRFFESGPGILDHLSLQSEDFR